MLVEIQNKLLYHERKYLIKKVCNLYFLDIAI